MVEMEDALKEVLTYLQTSVLLREKDEFIISLEDETQDEWVFHWDTKSWVETQDILRMIPGSHLIVVNKATGEFYHREFEWKLWED